MNVDAVGRRVEELLDQIAERDAVAAELTEDVLRELMALYGAGLGRILDRMHAAAPDAVRDVAADPLVDGLLKLHDLHPDDMAGRVELALDGVRPYLASHGGGVTLLGVDAGVVHLRLEGACDGCGSSQVTLQHAVEGAVLDAAPEIDRIEVAGATGGAANNGLIPAEALSLRRRDSEEADERGGPNGWRTLPDAPGVEGAAWEDAEALDGGDGGDGRGGSGGAAGVAVRTVDDRRIAVVRIDGRLYAYRDTCPRCDGSLAGGRMHGDLLDCPTCGTTFDGRRAGAAADGGRGLHPVPLLDDAGGVRVAVGALR